MQSSLTGSSIPIVVVRESERRNAEAEKLSLTGLRGIKYDELHRP